VIIGKLIPAGTGMNKYRDIMTEAPDYEPLPFYTSEAEDEMDLATWLREASTRQGGVEEPDLSILQGSDGFGTVGSELSDDAGNGADDFTGGAEATGGSPF
jgi:DNA-directed RNA polymerase subunit beta'